ncbi:MAG: ribonuclease E inhibitor RraB [Actinomycetota bacterium]
MAILRLRRRRRTELRADEGEISVEDLIAAELDRSGDAKSANSQAMRHYFSFSTRKAADEVAESLRSQGLEVRVDWNATERRWVATATDHVVIDDQPVHGLVLGLRVMAWRQDGEYDGWEMGALRRRSAAR